MPNSYPLDGIFNPHHTNIILYPCIFFTKFNNKFVLNCATDILKIKNSKVQRYCWMVNGNLQGRGVIFFLLKCFIQICLNQLQILLKALEFCWIWYANLPVILDCSLTYAKYWEKNFVNQFFKSLPHLQSNLGKNHFPSFTCLIYSCKTVIRGTRITRTLTV